MRFPGIKKKLRGDKGSGLILQPAGLEVLDWLELGERMRSLGARIDRLHGKACGSGRVVFDAL